MNALLLIAHGSRNPASALEISQLVEKVRASDSGYDLVDYAFLEITEPDIHTGLTNLIDAGANQIDVLPYFLAVGNHVAQDIPDAIERLNTNHPDVAINLLPHIGAAAGMPDLINQLLRTNRS